MTYFRSLLTPVYRIVVVVCLSVLGHLFAWGDSTAFDASIREAYQRDPAECVRVCQEYLESEGLSVESRVDALLFQARAHYRLGQRDDVLGCLERIAAVDPHHELDGALHGLIWREYLEVFGPKLMLKPGMSTIAVFDFVNCVPGKERSEWDGIDVLLARKLQAVLASSTTLRSVERERIGHVLKEFEISDLQDPDTQVRVGHLLGAQTMVFSEFSKIEKDIVVMSRIVQTETSEILGTREVVFRGGPAKSLPAIEELASDLAKLLKTELDEAALGANEYEAWVQYGRALDSLRSGSEADAFRRVSSALEIDPGFAQAKTLFENLEGTVWLAEGSAP